MAQTPEEKAKELVDKFKEAAKGEIFKGWIYYHKKCALIAVGFAIDAIKDCSVVAGYPLEEYRQVKEAIQKL